MSVFEDFFCDSLTLRRKLGENAYGFTQFAPEVSIKGTRKNAKATHKPSQNEAHTQYTTSYLTSEMIHVGDILDGKYVVLVEENTFFGEIDHVCAYVGGDCGE